MKVSPAAMTSKAFEFELIHDVSLDQCADAKVLADKVRNKKFRSCSFVFPPYLFDLLLKARRVYSVDNEDDILFEALSTWFKEREQYLK